MMATSNLPIEGTFDIARGRNTLRSYVIANNWTPMFGARAAALLTAIGELILYAGGGQMVIVKLNVIEDGDSAGVELACEMKPPSGDNQQYEKARQRLVRASDTLEIDQTPDGLYVRACVQVG
jgi:hypothetical protein